MSLEIKTKTTGFGSPAETYVNKRLDLNGLIPLCWGIKTRNKYRRYHSC